MACFLVSAAEALVATVATKVVEKKEKKQLKLQEEGKVPAEQTSEQPVKVPFSKKLKWLRDMLWGGSALLAFEHIWHGEVVPWFPFLTAASDPTEAAEMLHEMATVGVTMAVVVTLAWLGMLGVAAALERRMNKETVTDN